MALTDEASSPSSSWRPAGKRVPKSPSAMRREASLVRLMARVMPPTKGSQIKAETRSPPATSPAQGQGLKKNPPPESESETMTRVNGRRADASPWASARWMPAQ